MKRSPVSRARLLGLIGLCLAASIPLAASAAPLKSRLHGSVATMQRLVRTTSRLPSALRSASAMPVTIAFDHDADAADLAAIEALGGSIAREGGAVLGDARTIAARIPASAADAIGALPHVDRVALDGPVLPSPRPLDHTTLITGAQATWADLSSPTALTGQGITICDVDSGIDVFHPLFFRADGGYFAWTDTNGDGSFTVGVDTVDLGAGPVVLGRIEGLVSEYWSEDPLFGSDDPTLDPTLDYLYADTNGNGARDVGPAAGFTEADPTYGERLFAIDDVNGNRKLDVGEKLVALGTSKIKSFRIDNKTYRRGDNLIKAPWTPSMLHGTGAAGILAAGTPGLTRLVGMAPGADLVMATDTVGQADYQMTQFCIKEGARVVLHEYAPWVGYPLDGSTPTETLIDSSSAKGVSHVNPAGNLSGSNKLYKHTVPAGQVTHIPVDFPQLGAYFLGFTLIWRDPTRDLTLGIKQPSGAVVPVDATPTGTQVAFEPGVSMYAFSEDTSRGTRAIIVYIVSDAQGGPVPSAGDYELVVTDPAAPGASDLDLIAYVEDDVSGWGTGAAFTEFTSEDHLIGYPGTADHGMPVAAFTAHDFEGATEGARATYSGRGFRIDGTKIMWISGPDNPISAGHFEDRDLSYIVFGGTSGASPHVAGAAALVIQHDPTLTGDGVKEAIRAGATTDAFTGAVPNDDFGWGKVNVYKSIFGKDATGSAPTLKVDDVTMAPGTKTIAVTASDPDQDASTLELAIDRDYDGVYDETTHPPSFDVAYDAIGTYYPKLRVRDATGRTASAVLTVHVVEGGGGGSGGGGGAPDSRGISLAGGACNASGAAETSAEGLALAALGAAALLRRRRARSLARRAEPTSDDER
ncbi:MAG: S8 family serine peptidase [Polyangiaceae bacterium]